MSEVGYGKPPLHSRFQKGVSGNPRGRRKENAMEYDVKGEVLTIKVNVGAKAVKDAKPSASGKSKLVATTSGFVPLPNGMKFALNVIAK